MTEYKTALSLSTEIIVHVEGLCRGAVARGEDGEWRCNRCGEVLTEDVRVSPDSTP